MSTDPGYHANLQRGRLLRETNRNAEAREFLGRAIASDPNQAAPYLELALAEHALGHKKLSLGAVDRAVGLAPNSAHYLGYKAYLLSMFGSHSPALETAMNALQLDPNCHIALLAQTNAHTKLKRWIPAEISAHRMLALDPSDSAALNLLAQSLRLQDRLPESRAIIAQILALTPNDSFGHANAGYEALKAGDHLRANRHFLDSLRLDPQDDFARRGLLQSLRARMFIYRLGTSLATDFFANGKFGMGGRVLFVVLNIATGGAILGLLLLYVIFAFSLQPLSNFFLLFHHTGRRALTRREWRRAVLTGVVSASLLIIAAVAHLTGLVVIFGAYLLLFALSIFLPQFADARRARREERLVSQAPVS